MANRLIAGLAFLLVLSSSAVRAQDPATKDYRLGPDDVIEISVRDHPELTKQVTVMPGGKIAYAEVGEIAAAGKTPGELASEIQRALEHSRNNVFVVVTVLTVRSQKIKIVGAVKAAGLFDFRRGMRLIDAVAMSGGLAARPAMIKARLLRGVKTLPINMQAAMANPDTDDNMPLMPDDLIIVDEADPSVNKVFVMGRVQRPGAFSLGDEGRSVLSVLAEAGNVLEDAALTRVYVQRGTTEMPLNLLPVLVQGKTDDPVKSFQVQPGDLVFVPRIEAMFSVMGQVTKPGQYPISEQKDTRLLDALSLAGGAGKEGDRRKVGVIRTVNGQPSIMTANIDRMLAKSDFAENYVLQQGDIVFVAPARAPMFKWQDILTPFTALYYLGIKP